MRESSSKRTNEGFVIIASLPLSEEEELVIGKKDTEFGPLYVNWFCRNGNDYYWGNYSDRYEVMLDCILKRLKSYRAK